MTETSEMLALADKIDTHREYGTSAILNPDNAKIVVKALRSAARTDAGYGAGVEAFREAAKALVSDESADWHNTGYGRSVAKRIVDAILALQTRARGWGDDGKR